MTKSTTNAIVTSAATPSLNVSIGSIVNGAAGNTVSSLNNSLTTNASITVTSCISTIAVGGSIVTEATPTNLGPIGPPTTMNGVL